MAPDDDPHYDRLIDEATEAVARGNGDLVDVERLAKALEIQHGKMTEIGLIVATAELGLTPSARAFERIREILAEKRTA